MFFIQVVRGRPGGLQKQTTLELDDKSAQNVATARMHIQIDGQVKNIMPPHWICSVGVTSTKHTNANIRCKQTHQIVSISIKI